MDYDVNNLPTRLDLARQGVPFSCITYQNQPITSVACPGREGKRYQVVLREGMERVRTLQTGRPILIGKKVHLKSGGTIDLTPARIDFLHFKATIDGRNRIPFPVILEMGKYRTISVEVLQHTNTMGMIDCPGNGGPTLSYHSFMALFRVAIATDKNVSIFGTLPQAEEFFEKTTNGEIVRFRSWQGAGLMYGVITPRKFIFNVGV